jgi:GTPase-associated protein 1, N-terminal domain type 1
MADPAVIRVELAVFGERAGAHQLRASTLPGGKIPPQLAGMVDRPPHHPLDSLPLVACSPIGEWFALWRTFEDPSAPRGGMMRSFVALVRREHAGTLEQLQDLLDILPDLYDSPLAMEARRIEVRPYVDSTPSDSERWRSLCELLVDPERDDAVVLSDDGDWPRLLEILWGYLWPEARAALVCRHAVGPEALALSTTVVITPRANLSKWTNHLIVSQSYGSVPAAAKVIHERDHAHLRQGELDARPADLRIVGRLHRGGELFTKLREGTATSVDAKALMELVVRAAPEGCGDTLKAQISQTLARRVGTGALQDVLVLSNLQWPPSWLGRELCVQAVHEWMRSNLLALDGGAVSKVLARQRDPRYQDWWRGAIAAGISEVLKTSPSAVVGGSLWTWVASRPTIVEELEETVPFLQPHDRVIALAAPSPLAPESARALLLVAERRGLPHLHAVAISATTEPVAALRKQQAFRERGAEGVETLLSRLSKQQVLGLATAGFPDAIVPGADLIREDPELLDGCDVGNPSWRMLWMKAIERGLKPWAGVKDAARLAMRVIDHVLASDRVDAGFLQSISVGFPDVSRHSRRAEAWSRIAPEARDSLMENTATEIAERIQLGETVLIEDELASAVGRRVMAGVGRYVDQHLPVLVRSLPSFADAIIAAWLEVNGRRPINPTAAVKLGEVILEAKSKVAAELVYDRLVRRGEWWLRPVAAACKALIPEQHHWALHSSHVLSNQEKHEVFKKLREVCCLLFPEGPPAYFWDDIDGHASTRPLLSTGAESWQLAIDKIERGAWRYPKVSVLIKHLAEEFSNGEYGATLALIRRLLLDR